MASKRFCSACCFMVIFSICYNVYLLKKAKNDPTTEATFSCKEAVGMCSTSTAAAGHLTPCIDSSSFYTANCWLKSFRKRWLTSVKSRNPRVKDRQRFVTPCGFIQSLFLLICFAWCTVVSGIMIAIFSLSQMDVSKTWPLLILGLLAKLVLMPERDDHNSCNAEPPSNSKQCATSPTKVYIHQSVSIHLDVILATISMLLLRSGDVELNPGPRDRETDSNQPTDEPLPLSDSVPGPDLAVNSKAMSACSYTQRLPSQNDFQNTTPSPNFVPQPDTAEQGDESDHLAQQMREHYISSPEPLNDSMKGAPFRHFEKQQDVVVDSVHSQVEDESEPSEYYTFTKTAKRFINTAHYAEVQQDMPDYYVVEDRLTKEEFTKQVNNELDCLIEKGLENSFSRDDLDECTMAFFGHANSLYRADCRCDYCSICGRRKKDVASKDNPGGEYDSHVFPKGMLTVFRRIHCHNYSDSAEKQSEQEKLYTEFIYDFVLDERLGTSAWTYQLLCSRCEKKCSAAEQKLREVYVDLMRLDIVESLKFLNEDDWFNYMLVIIMFRGLLVSEKLSNCFNDRLFKAGFTKLWKCCKYYLIPKQAAEGVTEPEDIDGITEPADGTTKPDINVRLFLLPNRLICEEKTAFLYSLEYILRCPMFTRLVTSSESGSFFYWKFDCFHIVFALDETSRKYFNHFQNILHVHVLENDECKKHLILQWTNMHDSSTATRSKANAIQISYKSDKTPQLFPPALIQESKRLWDDITNNICHLASVADLDTKLLSSCKIMTDRYKGLVGYQYPDLDTSVPWEPNPHALPLSTETVTVLFGKKKDYDDDCIKEAASLSPLRLPEKISELESENKVLREIVDAIKKHGSTIDVEKFVEMQSKMDKVEQERLKDRDKYKEKQKKAGQIIINLKRSLTSKEEELAEEKTKAAREAQRAEQEKRNVNDRDETILLLQKELRYWKMQAIFNLMEDRCSPSMLRTGKTTLNNCMELTIMNGIHLSRQQRSFCGEAFEYINKKSGSMDYYHPVEYLDLSTGNAVYKSNHEAVYASVSRSLTC